MSPPEVQRYCERISELTRAGAQIKEIHAYTVARPTPEHFATALTPIELNELAETIRHKTGLPVAVFP